MQASTGKGGGGKGGGAASSRGSGGGLGSEAAASAKQGIQDALMRGPAAGMPVIGVVAELLSVDAGEGVVINPGILRVAATRAASAAMAAASPAKMHPLMSVEVTVSHNQRVAPLIFGSGDLEGEVGQGLRVGYG